MYSGTDKEVISQQWNDWLSIAHCMESSIRKAAKAALGKDKVKVQTYLNSGKHYVIVCFMQYFIVIIEYDILITYKPLPVSFLL